MIRGAFYFRLTPNGNLIGEFINDVLNIPSSESADLNGIIGQIPFVGSYISTWREENNPEISILDISLPEQTRKYILTWTIGPRVVFRGEGFLVDGLLIGNYWPVTP